MVSNEDPRNPRFSEAEVEPRENHPWRWGLSIFFALVVAGGAYFFLRAPAGPQVSIEFSRPDKVLAGDSFPFSVTFFNQSDNTLKGAVLSITLPDGISYNGSLSSIPAGDIAPNSVYKFGDTGSKGGNLVVTGNPDSVRRIAATLTYATDIAPNTTFKTSGAVDIVVGSPALALNVSAPTNVFSGQDFTATVAYENQSGHRFDNVQLEMQYPPAYTFVGSNVAAMTAANITWSLGSVPAAATGSITIKGNIVGPENANYNLNAKLKASVLGRVYDVSSGSASLSVSGAPLSLSVVANNAADYVAGLGDAIIYTLNYSNNTNVTFQNAAIKATLTGSMYDLPSLSTDGSFSSLTNTVTWNAANTPALLNILPGGKGTVNFKVKTKSAYPIRAAEDKNFKLLVNAQIFSLTVPPGTEASSTVSTVRIENKVGGRVTLEAKAYWRDAASGMLNSGPYPPKVDKATEYTLHWVVKNYGADMENVTVAATLQSGTTCTGKTKITAAASTSLNCDPANGSVTWTIPRLPITTGVVGAATEAIFQVSNTPAINQVGSLVTLLSATTLKATDAFTGLLLEGGAPSLTTSLPDDMTVANVSDKRVSQ